MASVIADRPLATIVKIDKILPIDGADKIVLAKILGWQCIVKKDEFTPDQFGIYFGIDSMLDTSDKNMAFMKEKKGRVKTIKMRGVISQGLMAPLSWLSDRGHSITDLKEGDDVTERLGVTKYVVSEELEQYDNGSTEDREKIPEYIRKTDEPRLQNMKNVLDDLVKLQKETITVTRKEDGQSGTFFLYGDKYHICGRNFVWKSPVKDAATYHHISEKYSIESVLRKIYDETKKELAIQGEIIGPKINSNRLKMQQYFFRVFNIWDIVSQQYLDWDEVKKICSAHKLDMVPELSLPDSFDFSLDAFLDFSSSQEYSKGCPAEGIVVKTSGYPRISFKVISNKYLLKYDL